VNGAVGNAPDVVVNVAPDPGSTVIGRVFDPQGNPLGGASVNIQTGLSIPLLARKPHPKLAGRLSARLAFPPVGPLGDPGPTGTTAPDGTFSIPRVPTVLGEIDAEVTALVDGSLLSGVSFPVIPISGGTTNLGPITLQQIFGCVTGTLHYFVSACTPNDQGPVQTPVDLIDRFGTFVATLTPDANGRFCADLRRNQFYSLSNGNYVDCSGRSVSCFTSFQLTDPNSTNVCSADPNACQDLGDINFFCGGS
jgi:hypothetical protein